MKRFSVHLLGELAWWFATLTGSLPISAVPPANVVLVGGLWSRYLAWVKMDAMTIGTAIAIRIPRFAESDRLMTHEYRHVQQQMRVGLFRFFSTYAKDFLTGTWRHYRRSGKIDWRVGYRSVRWEMDARKVTRED